MNFQVYHDWKQLGAIFFLLHLIESVFTMILQDNRDQTQFRKVRVFFLHLIKGVFTMILQDNHDQTQFRKASVLFSFDKRCVYTGCRFMAWVRWTGIFFCQNDGSPNITWILPILLSKFICIMKVACSLERKLSDFFYEL